MRDKKVFVKNIYYMLSYAFKDLRLEHYANVAVEEFDNIHNLLASILAKGIGWQLKHGLYREYVDHVEDISCVKGRIVMSGTIRSYASGKRMLTCDFDEFSENNIFNSVLKTTAMYLLRSSKVENEYKDLLRKEILFLDNVDIIPEPKSIRWSSIHFYQGNQTYSMLIAVCQLIIEGLLLTTGNGEYHLANFCDERTIEKLYEKFILEFYKKECPEIKASAPQIKWVLNSENTTDELLPKMMSDILLTDGRKTLIIDAKFKFQTTQKSQYGSTTLHSHNLYQIFTYVKNEALNTGNIVNGNNVFGMLLYAATDDGVILDHKYQMSGNQIWVKTLDLYREFKEIANDLMRIKDEHFGKSSCI